MDNNDSGRGSASSSAALRVLVAGAGRIGRMHAQMLARDVPGMTLAGVTDINHDAARELATQLGVPWYPDLDTALTESRPQALAICTPTPTHLAAIERAARAGVAVFCEKPLSTDLAEVDQALAVIEATKIPFMVGFNRRFDPGHASVLAAARDGRLGTICSIRITSRDPAPPPIEYIRASGGIFVDMMIHDLDLAAALAPAPVISVWATGSCLLDPAIGEAGDVDQAVAVLRHADGVTSTIDVSRQARYGYDQRVEILGTQALALSDNVPVTRASIWGEDGICGTPLQHFFLERYRDAYLHQWAAFARYLRDGGPSPVSAAEARVPIVLAIAARRSMIEHREIEISDITTR